MKENLKIFCIGETVLDIIFRDNQPIAARPGGSMLNSAVSLGRAGMPVYFISDYAQDHAGDLVHGFLMQNGVSTQYVSRYSDGKTALALAFLDDRQIADYSFYRIFPGDRLNLPIPAVQPGDIVLFGSYYALTVSIRAKLTGFIRNAKENGAFIIYDPNFRSAHLSELNTLKPLIMENISLASLVRGSDEDFTNIFGISDVQDAFEYINKAGCPFLIYTKNSEGVEVATQTYNRSYAVPRIKPVSTIGAGDAFNAGIIYAAVSGTPGSANPPGWLWDHLVETGVLFSEDVCQSLDNYISEDLGNRLKISEPWIDEHRPD